MINVLMSKASSLVCSCGVGAPVEAMALVGAGVVVGAVVGAGAGAVVGAVLGDPVDGTSTLGDGEVGACDIGVREEGTTLVGERVVGENENVGAEETMDSSFMTLPERKKAVGSKGC
jgi:hypothetical protein